MTHRIIEFRRCISKYMMIDPDTIFGNGITVLETMMTLYNLNHLKGESIVHFVRQYRPGTDGRRIFDKAMITIN